MSDIGQPLSAPLLTESTSRARTGPLLVLEGASKAFGGVRAVDDVSLSVPTGSVTGLIGPNGAGKSTVLSMIAGAIRPDRGRILLAGEDITGLPSFRVARHGVIRTFQTASVFPHLTVTENLLLGVPPWWGERIYASFIGRRSWRIQERDQLGRAREILERLRLSAEADSYAGELSGGQKRLVEIGRAIMARPRLLLLDEPMAGVNRILAGPIEELIADLRATGMTVVLIEHELGIVERLCRPVIVLAEGRVLIEGEMEDVRADPDVRRAYLVG
ncbi:MAG TPA: ABC transporter ATP-binding protein [Acidimicrobiales bacterium]|nr:ABC transporter ATP-binding protein [Acidimicrobiales bacterium]